MVDTDDTQCTTDDRPPRIWHKLPIGEPKFELIPGPKYDKPKTLILLLELWNSICNRGYKTPNFSGGTPFSNMCLQSGEGVSLSFM